MSDHKKFEIVARVSQPPETTTISGKKFEIVRTTFVVPRQTTPSGKMTITNKSRPRKCPLCQTEGQITFVDDKSCLCKKCGHSF